MDLDVEHRNSIGKKLFQRNWSPTFNHQMSSYIYKCWLSRVYGNSTFYRFNRKKPNLQTKITLWLFGVLQKSKPSLWHRQKLGHKFSCQTAFHTWNFSDRLICADWRPWLTTNLNSQRKKRQSLFQVSEKGCISLLLWGVRCFLGSAVHSVWQGQCGSCADIPQGSSQFGCNKTTQNVVFWNNKWLGCWLLITSIPTIQLWGVKKFWTIAISSSPGSKSTMDHQWLPFQN